MEIFVTSFSLSLKKLKKYNADRMWVIIFNFYCRFKEVTVVFLVFKFFYLTFNLNMYIHNSANFNSVMFVQSHIMGQGTALNAVISKLYLF